MKKIALVSHTLPPHWSGQAIMIGRIFSRIDPSKYIVIATRTKNEIFSRKICKPLKAKHYYLDTKFRKLPSTRIDIKLMARFFSKFLPHYINGMNFLFDFKRRKKRILEILRKENIQVGIACSGDPIDIPATYFACKKLKMDFYPYIFDYYGRQWPNKIHRRIATFLENMVLKNSKGFLVPNEDLYLEYKKRYATRGHVIHNSVDLQEYKRKNKKLLAQDSRIIKIVYTGAIYDAQFDAIKNMILALDILKHEFKIKLYIYSACSMEKEFRRNFKKLDNLVSFDGEIPNKEISRMQLNSDILFLPLAFNSDYPDKLINTSSPGKMGEYLSTGRPIVVHAPRGSFISKYFKKYKCGCVVDTYSHEELARKIRNLILNKKLQLLYGGNAVRRANIDFDVNKTRRKFIDIFSNEY